MKDIKEIPRVRIPVYIRALLCFNIHSHTLKFTQKIILIKLTGQTCAHCN